MSYSKLVLIGRPNVGKSSIFNLFAKVNKSIVMSHVGTTRNFVESSAEFYGMNFNMVDTPGYESKYFYKNIKEKYSNYIGNDNHLILFVVDAYHLMNLEILEILRPYLDRVILLINKIDLKKNQDHYYEFLSFGIKKVVLFSATNRIGFSDLAKILKEKELYDFANDISNLPLVSIIGRPNVGKSTLINSITENETLIVGKEAGLTTDSIKVLIDNKFVLVDTAGVRRQSLIKKYDEKVFVKNSFASLRKSHIVCIMVDAFESITSQDIKLINMAYEEGKGVILIINKCDLININLKTDEIHNKYNFLYKCKVFFTSAISLRSYFKHDLYNEVMRLFEKLHYRIPTPKLNKWIQENLRDLKITNGQKLIKYGLQARVMPLIIKLYYHNTKVEKVGYRNFIINSFYKYFNLYGIGIKIQLTKIKR